MVKLRSLPHLFLRKILKRRYLHVKAELLLFRRAEALAPVIAYTPDSKKKESDDFSIITRLINAYQRYISTQLDLGHSMWQSIFNEYHTNIHQAFMAGQFEKIAPILRNPKETNLFYGIDSLAKIFSPILSSGKNAYEEAIKALDGLVRFGEAIGAIRMDNPESYHQAPVVWQANEVVKKIESTLGQTICFPNPYPNEHGFQSSRGVISYRAPQALYQAWRAKQLLKNIKNPRVLEIGAGLGRTAYYAKMFGIEDYTIIDLPITSMVSGYFLARTLSEDQVLLLGENAPDSKQRIKFLSPADFLSSIDSYDLVINVDSLTEMDPTIAKNYWNRIARNSKIFLSINHENNQFTVKELIDQNEFVAQIDRFPYWMRRGYVEEVVQFISSND